MAAYVRPSWLLYDGGTSVINELTGNISVRFVANILVILFGNASTYFVTIFLFDLFQCFLVFCGSIPAGTYLLKVNNKNRTR